VNTKTPGAGKEEWVVETESYEWEVLTVHEGGVELLKHMED